MIYGEIAPSHCPIRNPTNAYRTPNLHSGASRPGSSRPNSLRKRSVVEYNVFRGFSSVRSMRSNWRRTNCEKNGAAGRIAEDADILGRHGLAVGHDGQYVDGCLG